jgi:thioredoxin 1
MKMEKSGIITLFAIALVVLLVTAGCAKGREEPKKQSQETATEVAAAPGKLESTAGTSKPAAPETGTTGSASASGKVEPAAKVDKPASTTSDTSQERAPASAQTLPRLVDVGRGTCIPCKMMAPILEELKREYSGVADIEVIDLRHDSRAAREYRIRVIPTQVFFDTQGKEVWRHEGFMSKEAIKAKFKEMGVELSDS